MKTTPSTRRIVTVAAGFAAAALILSGCAGASQSKEEACGIITDKMNTVSTELQASLTDVGTDPSAATSALETLKSEFDGVLGSITNEEVKAAGDKASASLGSFVDTVSAAVESGDASQMAGMTDSVTELQNGFSEIGTLCAS